MTYYFFKSLKYFKELKKTDPISEITRMIKYEKKNLLSIYS